MGLKHNEADKQQAEKLVFIETCVKGSPEKYPDATEKIDK